MRTSFTIPTEIYNASSALADTQKRPIAGIFRQAIEEYLRREGVEVAAPPVEWGGKRTKRTPQNQK